MILSNHLYLEFADAVDTGSDKVTMIERADSIGRTGNLSSVPVTSTKAGDGAGITKLMDNLLYSKKFKSQVGLIF